MPTIKLDGREIPYQPGDTIIRAAHRAGIDIPHYCWHPGLSVAANCRMCLVEIMPPAGQRGVRLDVLAFDDATKTYSVVNKPKLQPACQVPCGENMDVRSDSSTHVGEARKQVQEFLLLNHPVDCPICDQAGECRLQDYWLEHGRYKKRMHDEIVHKPKTVSFGPTIVYDAERCIVCTRCVRFVDEIAHDPVLDKRERGNLGEIFVSPGRTLDNNYTLMTEHVCPVGALTSKDFRFKARVWFLRSARAVCQGCATGCNAYLDFDPRNQTAYRYRPRENDAVNKYWMCDVGMLSYARAHERRITQPLVGGKLSNTVAALDEIKSRFGSVKRDSIAIVLSAQHSSEDNFALATLATTFLGTQNFFVTGKAPGSPDGILMVADRNPNTAGAYRAGPATTRDVGDLVDEVQAGRITHVIALGGDVPFAFKKSDPGALGKLKGLVVLGAHDTALSDIAHVVLPAATWAESDGTFVNAQNMAQRSERAISARGDTKPAWEWVTRLARSLGYAMTYTKVQEVRRAMNAAAPPVTAPTPEAALAAPTSPAAPAE